MNLKKGDAIDLDLRASRLGSPLDGVLMVVDATGKEIARADDMAAGQTDAQLRFTAPADGDFVFESAIALPRAAGRTLRTACA